MNGKKAKALRRLEKALEQEKLAFQEMLRRGTPVPVKTMSMDDFNKARTKATEAATLATDAAETATVNDIRAGLAVMSGEVDPDALAVEMDRANAIEQEVKIGLLVQNSKHYILSDEMTLTREDAFKAASPELLLESRRAAKGSLPPQTEEELNRLHQSVNGPEVYAKLGSMGSKA